MLSTAALWAQGSLNKGQGRLRCAARQLDPIRFDNQQWLHGRGAVFHARLVRNADGAAGDNGDHLSELRHAKCWSLGGFYGNGPIEFGAAFERNYRVRGVGRHDDAFSISGAYDFGEASKVFNARLAVIYERLAYDTLDGNLKRDFTVSPRPSRQARGSIYAFWGHAGDGKGTTADGTQVGV